MRRLIGLLWITACGSEADLGDDLKPPTSTENPIPETTTEPSPSDTSTDTGTDPLQTGTPPDTGLDDDEICLEAQALASFLDAYQIADDGRVLYCHSGSGANHNLIESDISSCLPHLNHDNDIFPTTGCDS